MEQLLSQNLQLLCIKGGVNGAIHPLNFKPLSDTQTNRFFHHTIPYINNPIMQSKAKKNCFNGNERAAMCALPNPAQQPAGQSLARTVTITTNAIGFVSTHLYQI